MRPAVATGGPGLMLALATVGFAVNFWAWALLSPLGPGFKEALGLTAPQQALLVAVPVVVGSVGRIPVGALTDRFGGRVMFPLVSIATVVPVLFLGLAGQDSLAALLVGGFFLGIGGTAFAVGVPFVNAWFPPQRRGLAIGIFGAGMGGTAISALTTVRLVDAGGSATPFLITALALAAYAVVAWLLLRDAPGRTVPRRGRLALKGGGRLKTLLTIPLGRFLDHLDRAPLRTLQESYVDTFDHRRRCCPYLTYYGYGDTRKRGLALLRFKQAYRAAGLELGADELPDHLAVVLEFAATGDPREGRRLLLEHRAGLEVLRLALADATSPYADVLRAVCATLPRLGGDDRDAVARLVAAGPPAEEVGLEPFAPPEYMPSPGGRR